MNTQFLNANALLLIEKLIEKKDYLRNLAEELKMPPSSVHNITKNLLKEKIISAKKEKNRTFFEINYSSALARELITLIFTNKIIKANTFKKLIALEPKGIYLFGSAANGTINAASDVDMAIFLKRRVNQLEINKIKLELSNEIKREVQLIVLTQEKIRAMEREKTELLNQIKRKAIVLEGEEID